MRTVAEGEVPSIIPVIEGTSEQGREERRRRLLQSRYIINLEKAIMDICGREGWGVKKTCADEAWRYADEQMEKEAE